MYIGRSHQIVYQMFDTACLLSAHEEKDLGVLVADNLKPRHQCSKTVANAMIHRGFGQVDMLEFEILYNTYVWPHCEYSIQAWSPNRVKDITTLEPGVKMNNKKFRYACTMYMYHVICNILYHSTKRKLREYHPWEKNLK